MEIDLSPLVIVVAVAACFFAAVLGYRDGRSL